MFCKLTCNTAFLNLLTSLKSGIEIFFCNLGIYMEEQLAQEQTVLLSVYVCVPGSLIVGKTLFPFHVRFMQLAGISTCNCELLDVNPNTFFLCRHGISNRGGKTKGQNSLLGYINKSRDYCCPSSFSLQWGLTSPGELLVPRLLHVVLIIKSAFCTN